MEDLPVYYDPKRQMLYYIEKKPGSEDSVRVYVPMEKPASQGSTDA